MYRHTQPQTQRCASRAKQPLAAFGAFLRESFNRQTDGWFLPAGREQTIHVLGLFSYPLNRKECVCDCVCSLQGNRRTLFTHGQEPDFSFIQTRASNSGQQTPQLTCQHQKISARAGDEHQRVINTHSQTHTHTHGCEKDGAEPLETLVSLWIRRHSAETMETNQDGWSRANSGCLLTDAVTKAA